MEPESNPVLLREILAELTRAAGSLERIAAVLESSDRARAERERRENHFLTRLKRGDL